MSFGPFLLPFGCKTLALPYSYILDSGNTDELEWLGKEKHNYGHLLRVTIPRNSALLVVRVTLKDLAAYSADFVPLEALDTFIPPLMGCHNCPL